MYIINFVDRIKKYSLRFNQIARNTFLNNTKKIVFDNIGLLLITQELVFKAGRIVNKEEYIYCF